MKLREFFSSGLGLNNNAVHNAGTNKLSSDVFNEELNTPQHEMDKALQVYENRIQITSGINQIAYFVLGNGLKCESDDEYTRNYVNKWIEQRKNIKNEIFKFVVTQLVTGNGAIEPMYTSEFSKVMKDNEDADEKLIVDNIFNVNDVSRIYINTNTNVHKNVDYIFEMPYSISNKAYKEGELGWYRISYSKGDNVQAKQVYGLAMNKKDLWFCPIGWSRSGIYGRGIVMSMVNDVEVMSQILKNYATIAKYRAIGKKIITVGTDTRPGTQTDVEGLEKEFGYIESDGSNFITNKDVNIKDLSYNGQNIDMSREMDFLRQDIGSGLVPNHMTPWAASTTYATAGRAQIPFELYLENFQKIILDFLEEKILDNLKKHNPKLSEDAKFTFGKVSLDSMEEKERYATNMFRENGITLNEYREMLGFEPIENGDQFKYQMENRKSRF